MMSHTGWPSSRASVHRRRNAVNSQRHRRTRGTTAPSTPLLRWNADAAPASSRQLAAGLWHLRVSEFSAADSLLFSGEIADRLSPQLNSAPRNPNFAIEKPKKTNPRSLNQDLNSKLRAELAQAKTRVRDLEAKRKSFTKRLSRFSEKLAEDLARERNSRQRAEILNAALVKRLTEVNSWAEKRARDYEEEKNSREFTEEVCERLVQQLGEDRAKSERAKSALTRVAEELEEERSMLQLAEAWREERVHMKLEDSRIALEAKFSEMNLLVAELEALIGFRGEETVASEVSLESKHNVSLVSTNSFSCKGGDRKTNPHIARGMRGCIENRKSQSRRSLIKAKDF